MEQEPPWWFVLHEATPEPHIHLHLALASGSLAHSVTHLEQHHVQGAGVVGLGLHHILQVPGGWHLGRWWWQGGGSTWLRSGHGIAAGSQVGATLALNTLTTSSASSHFPLATPNPCRPWENQHNTRTCSSRSVAMVMTRSSRLLLDAPAPPVRGCSDSSESSRTCAGGGWVGTRGGEVRLWVRERAG